MRLPPEVFLGQQLEATRDPRQIVLLERMPRLDQELLSKLRACCTHRAPLCSVAAVEACPGRDRRFGGADSAAAGRYYALRSAFNSRTTLSLQAGSSQ